MLPLLGLTVTARIARPDDRAPPDRGRVGSAASSARRSTIKRSQRRCSRRDERVYSTARLEAIAEAVRPAARSAREIAQETLNRIEARNGALGAFTDVTATRALAKADAYRRRPGARDEPSGRLLARRSRSRTCSTSIGLPTRAGSKINRERAPRRRRTRRLWRVSKQPAQFWSARSTWANTPTISPGRTRTTALLAIRTISSI